MTEQNLTPKEMAAFNDRMFSLMVQELATLPFNQLCSFHDELVDKHNETAAPTERAAVGFALSAMGEAIRQRQIKRALN